MVGFAAAVFAAAPTFAGVLVAAQSRTLTESLAFVRETEAPPNVTIVSESSSGEWAIGMLATLAVLTVIVCVWAMWFMRKRLAEAEKAHRRRKMMHGDGSDAMLAMTQSLFAGAALGEADPPVAAVLADARPLKQGDLNQIEAMMLHAHTETPPTELPFAPDHFPRGPGKEYVVVAEGDLGRTLQLLHVQVTQVWYSKQGDLYSEVMGNLRYPALHASNAHVLVSEVARALWKARGPGPEDIGPFQNLCLKLLSQEATDTDRMLLWEAPVWIPCSTVSKHAFESHKPNQPNGGIVAELDAAALKVNQTRFFGNREAAFGSLKKWIKLAALASMLAQPRATLAHAGLSSGPVYKAFRQGKDIDVKHYVVWLTPLACSTSAEAAREFLSGCPVSRPVEGEGAASPKPSERFPMLLRLFGCEHLVPVLGSGQYPVEQSVLVPMMTPFRVEAVRVQSDSTVVDLHYVPSSKYVPSSQFKRFRKDVIEDAWAGENTLDRVDEILKEYDGARPLGRRRAASFSTPTLKRAAELADKSGFVRGLHSKVDCADTTRCHECGSAAHGMHPTLQRQAADQLDMLPQQSSFVSSKKSRDTGPTAHLSVSRLTRDVPRALWVSGELGDAYIGVYKKRKGERVWVRGDVCLKNVGHRWAVCDLSEEAQAHMVSAKDVPVNVLPHSVVRWARPVGGAWAEDPTLRVTAKQPVSLLADSPPSKRYAAPSIARESVVYTPPSVPMPMPLPSMDTANPLASQTQSPLFSPPYPAAEYDDASAFFDMGVHDSQHDTPVLSWRRS